MPVYTFLAPYSTTKKDILKDFTAIVIDYYLWQLYHIMIILSIILFIYYVFETNFQFLSFYSKNIIWKDFWYIQYIIWINPGDDIMGLSMNLLNAITICTTKNTRARAWTITLSGLIQAAISLYKRCYVGSYQQVPCQNKTYQSEMLAMGPIFIRWY